MNKEVLWFTGHFTVGIVRVVDPCDGPSYYIGTGLGNNEQVDIQYIAEWGATFPKEAGDVLFKYTNVNEETPHEHSR